MYLECGWDLVRRLGKEFLGLSTTMFGGVHIKLSKLNFRLLQSACFEMYSGLILRVKN